MRVKEFVSKLRLCDSRIRLVPGPNRSSGLYIKQPRHPDANEQGLRWIGAVQSPSWFWGSMQSKDWFDKDGGYNRGWMTVVGLLVKGGYITKRSAGHVFGWEWCIPGIYGKLTPYKGWNDDKSLQGIERKMQERIAAL